MGWNRFQKELEDLINKHSLENNSDTPDFILAEYLMSCLNTWNVFSNKRRDWYRPESVGTEILGPPITLAEKCNSEGKLGDSNCLLEKGHKGFCKHEPLLES